MTYLDTPFCQDEYHGCYVSKFSDPDAKWRNERLLWDGNDRLGRCLPAASGITGGRCYDEHHDSLVETGLADKTAIVFVSDHGWQLGEHRLWSKNSNYEEAVRVPLLVAAPGITKGEKTDALAELVDIYSTVCELAGVEIPKHVEGVSMVPLLKNPSRVWKKAAFNVWRGSTSMRTARYRLTRYDEPTANGTLVQCPSTGRYELYDYEADPAAEQNLAADSKDKDLLE